MLPTRWSLSGRLAVVCCLLGMLGPAASWDSDLELFDLVEEVPQTFYSFLSVQQDAPPAEIKKAYRRLSLVLHPDKNKDPNAETQFRQLVSIYEVLKDEERRHRYDDILLNGLPDWKQPVFYYRRVRKLSNSELAFLLFLILTVGHYAVIWSIYLEKQLDEMLSKKKKEKKKKMTSKPLEELRAQDRPHWQDILPLKLSIWIYLSIQSLPHTIQEVKQYYEDYAEMKVKEREEEQEAAPREKRVKVKKPKVEFPIYEVAEGVSQSYETSSIQEVEQQLEEWLLHGRSSRKQSPEWTEEDLSMLSRSMVRFPGGTPGRWEKIAHELGRAVADVTTKVKQVKDSVSGAAGMVKLAELTGGPPPSKPPPGADGLAGAPNGGGEEVVQHPRRRCRKTAGGAGGEVRVKSRRQRDFVEEEEAEDQEAEEEVEEVEEPQHRDSVWTQNQQKLLETALQQNPRGTAERWDRIAKMVPGKSKEDCMIRYKLLAELIQKRKQKS